VTEQFLERLAAGPLLCDGGYFRELERARVVSRLTDMPRAVLEYPEAVLAMHRQFVLAGAEVLQAVGWSTGIAGERDGRFAAAVRLVRDAAGPERFVAGTLTRYIAAGSATWGTMSSRQRTAAEALFERRIGEQAAAGVDLVILETFDCVEEVALAIPYVKRAGLPCVVTLAFGESDFTRDAYLPGEAARRLVDAGADVVGANCRRPPRTLLPLLVEMRRATGVPLCAQPAAYEADPAAVSVGALAEQGSESEVAIPSDARLLTPRAMADFALQAQALGVGLIGACCGAQPHHIRAMAEALQKPTGLPEPIAARRPVPA
jgi:betaine-homocysteine S-methyltransferase